VTAIVIVIYNPIGIHFNELPIATEKALFALRAKEPSVSAASAAAVSARD
jgi:hypothetical protein